jgi:biopolymer transport protein ExbB/TolQ
VTGDITAITALVVAIAGLAGAIPAIIIAIKGNSKASANSTIIQKEVTRANKQDDALLDLQNKVNGGSK